MKFNRPGLLLLGWVALLASPALAAESTTQSRLEECLLARFQEKDTNRTDYAVLLSSRYRYASDRLAAGDRGAAAELTSILQSCRSTRAARVMPLARVAWSSAGPLIDGGDSDLLLKALESARTRLSKLGGRTVVFGTERVKASDLARGHALLVRLLEKGRSGAELDRAIRDQFDLYRSPGAFGTGEVLFTSYAGPVYSGSLKKDSRFKYPIYRNPSRAGISTTAHDRASIYAGALAGRGLEIAWLANRMDEYQLQVEGSGFIRLPDGTFLHTTFGAKNGRPYRSLGKAMVKAGVFAPWDIDNLAVRRYFRAHPAEEQGWLEKNPSFVYFDVRRMDKLPETVDLVAERSVAADASYFPRGALAFAATRLSVYDADGKQTGWRPFSRFVVPQDVGGAIKGPGRIDLYQGEGEQAQLVADTAKEPGTLYLLLPRGAGVERSKEGRRRR